MVGYKSSRLILPTVLAASVMMSARSNPYLERFRAEFGWTEARLTEDGWLKSRDPPSPMRSLVTRLWPNQIASRLRSLVKNTASLVYLRMRIKTATRSLRRNRLA